ncbi:hypothetical protein [Halobacillus trueperi]|uniref:hypothetical protein n=1 Tax=Halobacillus trueperi TaxID=156205 RepID=UPI0037356606
MDPNFDFTGYSPECIDAMKVLDYVVTGGNGTATVRTPPGQVGGGNVFNAICDAVNQGGEICNIETTITSFDAECEAEVIGTELVDLMDGEEPIELQLVQVTKSGSFDVSTTFDVCDSNGEPIPDLEGITVNGTIDLENTVCEAPVLMCCPNAEVGDTIDCSILEDSSTISPVGTRLDCSDDPGQNGLFITYLFTICQALQCSEEVKLEVMARPCRPRRPIIRPTQECIFEPMPNPCSRVFPTMHDNDNNGNW